MTRRRGFDKGMKPGEIKQKYLTSADHLHASGGCESLRAVVEGIRSLKVVKLKD